MESSFPQVRSVLNRLVSLSEISMWKVASVVSYCHKGPSAVTKLQKKSSVMRILKKKTSMQSLNRMFDRLFPRTISSFRLKFTSLVRKTKFWVSYPNATQCTMTQLNVIINLYQSRYEQLSKKLESPFRYLVLSFTYSWTYMQTAIRSSQNLFAIRPGHIAENIAEFYHFEPIL